MSPEADMLQFVIRGRRCAMYVQSVKEVVPMPSITPVPLVAAAVRGVMPLRGHPVVVLDLGPDLAPTRQDSQDDGFDVHRKPQDEFVLIIESPSFHDSYPARAALCVDQVLCVRATNPEHMRATSAVPPFVTATMVDADGPALVIDATRAMEHVMATVQQAKVMI